METMERYLELTENGRPRNDDPEQPRVRQTLVALVNYARQHDGLALEGAWRLESEVARELTERAEYVPAGGWRAAASLAAGTGVLETTRTSFEPAIERAEIANWKPGEATRRLLEAFTCRLVPPTTAAGLFILLGIHPAWGVHVAHRAHRRFGPPESKSGGTPAPDEKEKLFPDGLFEVVDRAVFDVVSVLVAGLRRLDPSEAYPVDALSGFVDAVCTFCRKRGKRAISEVPLGAVEPFVDLDRRSANWRVIDFTTADLIDAFLVPAGAAHRFNDGSFSVVPGAFEGVRVGEGEPAEQSEALTAALTDGDDCRVA